MIKGKIITLDVIKAIIITFDFQEIVIVKYLYFLVYFLKRKTNY